MLIEGLYTIKDSQDTDEGIVVNIRLNKDHDIFKGHFPGNPVMPGVCMIQIIKELTEKKSEKKLLLTSSSNIKFMAIINPEMNPELELNISITEEDGQLKVKNTTSFGATVALKLNAIFRILN